MPVSVSKLTPGPWSAEDLSGVAKWQRYIIVLLVLVVLGLVVSSAVGAKHFIVFRLALVVAQAYFIYKLAEASRADYPIVYSLACLVPWMNVMVLLYANHKATKVLKANGIVVGLLGARMPAPDRNGPSNQAL